MDNIVIPPYMEQTLDRREIVMAGKWFRGLKYEDRENVLIFLNGSYLWAGEMQRRSPRKYFVMSSVGSTLTGKEKYGDIDFMIISNSDFEGELDRYGQCKGLASHLIKTHHVTGASLGPDGKENSIYKDLLQNFPGRDLLSIVPQGGFESPWKKIHLIIQPTAPSETEWDAQDRFLKLPLFRLANL